MGNLWHYLKYSSFHLIGLLAVIGYFAGGFWISFALMSLITFYVIGDGWFGDDVSTPVLKHTRLLDVMLWLALPLTALFMFAAVWSVSQVDIFNVGMLLSGWLGTDLLAAREQTATIHHVAGVILGGLMVGMIATIPAHELVHRTQDKLSLCIGRWCLAFSFDASFSEEHVYGHHRYVATPEDPATAPRGRNVYHHIVVSTVKCNISAWQIEQRRLNKKQLPVWSAHNRVLRGYLMSLTLLCQAFFIGGFAGLFYFVAIGLAAKSMLEIVNYMEHYGLVRMSNQRVGIRHSWNTNRRLTSWSMFNLSRHSHHHAKGNVPFHELKPFNDAPMMVGGYLTTILVTLVPPLWHKYMVPKLLDWDSQFATDDEQQLAREANQRSGLTALIVSAES